MKPLLWMRAVEQVCCRCGLIMRDGQGVLDRELMEYCPDHAKRIPWQKRLARGGA